MADNSEPVAPIEDEVLGSIRAEHTRCHPEWSDGFRCSFCSDPWPCESARFLARLDAAEAGTLTPEERGIFAIITERLSASDGYGERYEDEDAALGDLRWVSTILARLSAPSAPEEGP